MFFLSLGVPFFIAFLIGDFNAREFLFLFGSWFFLSALVYVFCKRTQIIIQQDGFVYQSPYGKKTFVRWAEIKASSLEVLPSASTVSFAWKFERFAGREVNIILGYFSRNKMKIFATQVIQQTRGAHLSESIYRVANGQFPWYIF